MSKIKPICLEFGDPSSGLIPSQSIAAKHKYDQS